jgi:hypothetical protein
MTERCAYLETPEYGPNVFLWIGFMNSTGGRGVNLMEMSARDWGGEGGRWGGGSKETHMFMRCMGRGGPRGASGLRLPAKPPEKPDISFKQQPHVVLSSKARCRCFVVERSAQQMRRRPSAEGGSLRKESYWRVAFKQEVGCIVRVK